MNSRINESDLEVADGVDHGVSVLVNVSTIAGHDEA